MIIIGNSVIWIFRELDVLRPLDILRFGHSAPKRTIYGVFEDSIDFSYIPTVLYSRNSMVVAVRKYKGVCVDIYTSTNTDHI